MSEGSLVSFSFDQDFENEDCNSTYINLYEGETSGVLIRKICNMDRGVVIRSTSNTMRIEYVTKKEHSGFKAQFGTGIPRDKN